MQKRTSKIANLYRFYAQFNSFLTFPKTIGFLDLRYVTKNSFQSQLQYQERISSINPC